MSARIYLICWCDSMYNEQCTIVEVQWAKQNYFKDRSVYYSSFPIQQQAVKGSDWDFKLEAVYTIGILDFIFEEDKEDKEYIHTVQLKNHKNKVFYDKLTFIYIELPKFDKTVDNLESKIEKWLFVFRHLSRLQDRHQALQEKIYEKLFATAEIAKFSKEDRELYEESLKYYRDLKNGVDTAFEDGQVKRNYEVAKEMKEDGLPIEKISKYAGLSKEEIEKL
ncbi:MAG: Rpn family recombination-promoting nuclease/putative transposase [Bacteroidia bacterium]|nr:Rpn family recombination-promoting nuclease/putative transposase [Bacteroidia bacterium]